MEKKEQNRKTQRKKRSTRQAKISIKTNAENKNKIKKIPTWRLYKMETFPK